MSEMGEDVQHEDCWAKTKEDGSPGINVRDHCLNVGSVAEALLVLLLPRLRRLMPPGAVTLAALHDVGKVSPGFQIKCQSWVQKYALGDQAIQQSWATRESDHAKMSQYTVQQLLQNSALYPWAAAVGAHHGRIKGLQVQIREPWDAERVRLAKELIAEFGPLPSLPPGDNDAKTWLLAGLITVADWIGSDEMHFPQHVSWNMAERRQRGRAALTEIHWQRLSVSRLNGFSDLFPGIPRPNNLQTATLELVRDPGVYVVEGPMGYGKTEAALAAAYQLIADGKANGLYFALPTQVTSNRIHLRVKPFVERICGDSAIVRLAHSSSWIVESEPMPALRAASPMDPESEENVKSARSWFASSKRALLVPFGVGTIDQALLGIVASKHFFVRQFGLAGKVVILDEVHTYDIYTGTLITALVKRLRDLQCTVLVLSATLTEKRRRELLELHEERPLGTGYPMVSGVVGSLIEQSCEPPPSKSVRIRSVSRAIPVREVLERASSGECLLWIRNTVDEAQETYRALHDACGGAGPSLALLHSRFPFFRRAELEDYWMDRLGKDCARRPSGCVLVSTQVTEQSVDIDADLLITDLAPTDMLLQRLGRLWRHQRPDRPCLQPEVWIQMPDRDDGFLDTAGTKGLREALGKSGRIYAPYVLLRSHQQWCGRATVTLPGEIRQILEATYADPPTNEPAAWRELREELEKKKEKMAGLALNATAVWNNPALADEEGIQTRYNSYPSVQLLLARQITLLNGGSVVLDLLNGSTVTASSANWNFATAKAIHLNLVRVPRWAATDGLRDSPPWLTNYVSQSAVALVQESGIIRWHSRREATGLTYNAEQGIVISRDATLRAGDEELDESCE